MNAAIRAVTRSAIYNGMRVKGIYRGYKGLILDEIEEFKTQNVSNIIQRGGTILKTARCVEGRIITDRRIRAIQVIINRTRQSYDREIKLLSENTRSR